MDIDCCYGLSDEVVARDIEGELVIVPLTSDVGDMEDELYTLNETGRVIWQRLDGTTPLRDLISQLAEEYDAPVGDIQADVVGLMNELLSRKLLIANPSG